MSIDRTGAAMNHGVFFRAHTVTPERSQRKGIVTRKWTNRVLIIDTETTTDTRQELTFGVYRVCSLVLGNYLTSEEGIFHSENCTSADLKTIKEYAEHNNADLEVKSFPPKLDLKLRSRAEFTEKVLWKAVRDGCMIVGFNLPFDLSRIAIDWCKARNGGWSLIFSMRRSRKTGRMEPNPDRPRIRVTSKDSKSAFIALMRPRVAEEWPQGRFLDLHTLAFALRSESHSLDNACAAFGVPGKIKHEPTGKISTNEIDYCRQDVRATTHLLNTLKREFDRHPISVHPDRAYSPASIAKAYLDAMGIQPPLEKFKTPHRMLGIAMQAYYGGRAECRIRHVSVPIVHTDFTSQYPSVNALLGNGEILTAQDVSFIDATNEIRNFVDKVTLERAFDPQFWKQLKFFALVRPNNDIFPVRAVYNNQTQNIGVNRLSSDKPIWFAGPDVLASILLTGKVPRIEKAIRVIPRGKQSGLQAIKLRGLVTINPKTDDFFTHVIEQRKLNKSDESLSHFLKILANAGSYGLFVELTPEKPKRPTTIKVFSGQESFSQMSSVLENQGKWYFPPVAALITAGGRLLLSMLERCVKDMGGSYLFCDTDSLCVVASERGDLVPCPGGNHKTHDGKEAIKALSWNQVEKIAEKFTSLNPYDRKAVPGSILKIEDVNFYSNKTQRQLYGYAISAKRYVLYQWTNDELNIIDPKAHGLGYLFPPKSANVEEKDWTFEAWEWLLREALGLPRNNPAWLDLPAMMRIVLSTPHVLQRLGRSTRPFSFLLCPLTDPVAGYPAGVDPNHFTLITPFTKDRNRWMEAECINICDGKTYHLASRQSSKLDKAIPQTFGYVLRLYPCHLESKSLAPDGTSCSASTRGLLQRASIRAGVYRYVGKETDRRWEQGEDLSLKSFSPVEYSAIGKITTADAFLLSNMAKHSIRELMRKSGLSHHTLGAIRDRKAIRIRTLTILRQAIQSA